MIISRHNLNTLFTGYKAVFTEAFNSTVTDYEAITMTVNSTTAQESYAWLGTNTRFREWLGDRVLQNIASYGYTIRNRRFENTIGIDLDSIEDDTFGLYKPIVAQLGQDAKRHPDELVFSLLKDGETALCYDGKPFFATNHPVIGDDGKTKNVSNLKAGTDPAWYLIDSSRMVKPIIFQKRKDYEFVKMDSTDDELKFTTRHIRYGIDCRVNVGFGLWQLAYCAKVPLTADNFSDVRRAMVEMRAENGKPLGLKPDLLLVPPSLEFTAQKLLAAEMTTGGETNIMRNMAKVLTSVWLT
jgi:phage major head subunit gpT-like protein